MLCTGFVAYLFPGDTTPAFGASRLWMALGFATGFLVSHLATGNVAVILYLLLGVIVVATVFYIIILFTTKRFEQVFLYSVYCPKKVTCPADETPVETNDTKEELLDELKRQSTSFPSDDMKANTDSESTV